MRLVPVSPWLYVWLILVLMVGVAYSLSQRKSVSILPGEVLLQIGFVVMVLGGMLGSARTGKWTTWDGRVIPNRLEWFIALTGAALFVSPFVHLLLLFVRTWLGSCFR